MSRRTLETRLRHQGGDQLSRINKQKLNSLQWALRNDYNSREIVTPAGFHTYALINTNNLKSDYDKEYVSVEFSSGLEAGDVFEIVDDGSHWMIYLPIITETAYLRAEIIKCRYEIDIEGEKYWVYFQGPTETDLRWFIKSGINYNELNLSGTIYIKNTPKTKEYFKRFTKLELDGHMWEVQVTDSITVPGIIELEIQEYYDNTIAELPKVIIEEQEEGVVQPIIGSTTIKHGVPGGYSIDQAYYKKGVEWEIANNPRVRVDELFDDGRICKVILLPAANGSFDLIYGEHSLHIEIESPELEILGPQSVYPYETHKYWVEGYSGTFMINNKDLVNIVSATESSCEIRIITGKKGEFKVGFVSDDGAKFVLPVSIGSL